jgi:small subunit ribosomal protein S7
MRKFKPEKRTLLGDPKYNSVVISKLINMIMLDGKKGLAQSTVYGALTKAGEKAKKDPLELFQIALDNIGPSVELKVRRLAGANYQVPTEVNPERKQVLALR